MRGTKRRERRVLATRNATVFSHTTRDWPHPVSFLVLDSLRVWLRVGSATTHFV
jgi:hypothetical protein